MLKWNYYFCQKYILLKEKNWKKKTSLLRDWRSVASFPIMTLSELRITMKVQLAVTYFFWLLSEADAQSIVSASFSTHNTGYSHNTDYSAPVITSTPVSHHYPSTIDSTIYPTTAPQTGCGKIRRFSICWVDYPPYLMKDENGDMTGIFHDAFENVLNVCCKMNSSNWFNYTRQAKNFSQLSECMKSDEIDFVFPVLRKQVKSNRYNTMRFQELLPSPGIAVLKNRTQLEQWAKWNVMQEFFQTWTVLVLALLLNAIFGILIWALVSEMTF